MIDYSFPSKQKRLELRHVRKDVKKKTTMPIKYKLYYATEKGDNGTEFYSKKDLLKFDIEEEGDLYQCASLMMSRFNRGVKDAYDERYCYKLEKISVRVIGSDAFYGLNISPQMCEPEFK